MAPSYAVVHKSSGKFIAASSLDEAKQTLKAEPNEDEFEIVTVGSLSDEQLSEASDVVQEAAQHERMESGNPAEEVAEATEKVEEAAAEVIEVAEETGNPELAKAIAAEVVSLMQAQSAAVEETAEHIEEAAEEIEQQAAAEGETEAREDAAEAAETAEEAQEAAQDAQVAGKETAAEENVVQEVEATEEIAEAIKADVAPAAEHWYYKNLLRRTNA